MVTRQTDPETDYHVINIMIIISIAIIIIIIIIINMISIMTIITAIPGPRAVPNTDGFRSRGGPAIVMIATMICYHY